MINQGWLNHGWLMRNALWQVEVLVRMNSVAMVFTLLYVFHPFAHSDSLNSTHQ
jgi:hypothetical protein